jgi:hypothetical protein
VQAATEEMVTSLARARETNSSACRDAVVAALAGFVSEQLEPLLAKHKQTMVRCCALCVCGCALIVVRGLWQVDDVMRVVGGAVSSWPKEVCQTANPTQLSPPLGHASVAHWR